MTILYKIVPRLLWLEAAAAEWFTGSPVDIDDGYMHFSTADTVRETAAKHFAGQRDLVLVAVASESLGSALKWEYSRGGVLFPHLYAPLPIGAVVWSVPLLLGADGQHQFPEEVP